MIKISEYLNDDIEKYKEVYNGCDECQKNYFKSYLWKYEWQFEKQSDFIKWYLQIVK